MSIEFPYRGMPQLSWDVACLGRNREIRGELYPASAKIKRRAYPVKLLRYWFMCHFLRIEHQRRQKPLAVCEIGIDRGQMRRFFNSITRDTSGFQVPVASWSGVDCEVRGNELQDVGYTSLVEADIETSDAWLDRVCDVTILLHVLEHLREPEKALATMARGMKPGSVLVGGSPSIPDLFVSVRERQLRQNPHVHSYGHVSKMSLKRIQRCAAANGLVLEFAAGAFLARLSGSWIEDHRWWLRLNLLFGALCPWCSGEIYWVLRKP